MDWLPAQTELCQHISAVYNSQGNTNVSNAMPVCSSVFISFASCWEKKLHITYILNV